MDLGRRMAPASTDSPTIMATAGTLRPDETQA
jgi:hypothetical protein